MSGEGLDRGVVRAPGWPIAVAGACALAAVVTALVGAQMTTAPVPLLVAGYLLGAVITVALSSVFRALRDARRKDCSTGSSASWSDWAWARDW